MERAQRMERALKILCRSGSCEHFTTGIGACFRNGRKAAAQYGSEQACPACIADYALTGHVRGKTIEGVAVRLQPRNAKTRRGASRAG